MPIKIGMEIIMDARRAQDLLRHITQDKDYGLKTMQGVSLSECIYMVNTVLPSCVKQAEENLKGNDAGFFSKMIRQYRALAIEKIKNEEHLWIAYTDLTGYPYMIDGDMIVIYDYSAAKQIENNLNKAGYRVTFGNLDSAAFKSEIAHMYRNGYKKIRFMDGKDKPFIVEREEFFSYDEFFDDDYVTNPGLEAAMLEFFQEFRKQAPLENRDEMLKRRERKMLDTMVNAEYMVPCIKEENEETVEISHPFIDLTERVKEKQEGEKVIAVPVFTDGFEMDKCYEGHHENMLYKFGELINLTEELGASGIIINCLGISYFMRTELMKKIKC